MIKVMEGGKTAYLGLGFSDRADSFDVNTTLHDHFKGIKVRLLQDCVSFMSSVHSVPPYAAANAILLCLVVSPPSHDFEQGVQFPHSPLNAIQI